jgi:hypothetical protein
MAYIGQADQERLKARFEQELDGDVRLLLFLRPPGGLYIPGREEPQTTRQTEQLLREVAALSTKLRLEVHNVRLEPDVAQRYDVKRTPALVLLPAEGDGPPPTGSDAAHGSESDATASNCASQTSGSGLHTSAVPAGRVRFFGMPSGYEFSSLIDDVVDVSRGRTRLSEATREALAALATPLHFQVFVTPT